MTVTRALRVVAVVVLGMSLVACSNARHYVVASTGTSIGVEIAQNPASQSPHAKLGYQRAEVAIVPTNRPDPVPEGQGAEGVTPVTGGAKDVGDVLMELRYSGIFDRGPSSGIYQRLAVGKEAVSQPGASFMFARNTRGEIDPETADKVLKAHRAVAAIPSLDPAPLAEKARIHAKFRELERAGNTTELQKFESVAAAAGYPATGHATYPAYRNFLGDDTAPLEKAQAIRRAIEALNVRIP